MSRKLISLVIPAYNEEDVLDELYRRLVAVFEQNRRYDFEVIMIENGSQDRTWEHLLEINRNDSRFKIIRLSRNFRMDGGITAGFPYVSGDAAVIMSADLQDPPEMITRFVEKWEEGYENVYGVVTRRQGTGLIRRMNSQIFYWILNKLTGGLMPRNASDFRLVDRKVLDVVKGLEERNRYVRGLFIWSGFRTVGIEHERAPRFAGDAKSYTSHVLALAFKAIFAHTYIPLKLITLTGLALSAFAFAFLAWIVYRAIAFGVPFAGFGTIMGVMLLMFGFLFTMLGVVSEYVGLIYEEVKARPNFIVKETVGLTGSEGSV